MWRPSLEYGEIIGYGSLGDWGGVLVSSRGGLIFLNGSDP